MPTLSEEVVQFMADLLQAAEVRNCAGYFDGETEPIGHRLCPSFIGDGFVGPVEGRVDFDCGEYMGISLEMASRGGKTVGIIFRDVPTGAADA